MLNQRLARARINRILKRFTSDDEPELIQFVSGVNEPPAHAIDDGSDDYGDIEHDKRADFVKRDLIGWK